MLIDGRSEMDPTEALRRIRVLIRTAETTDDIDLVRKLLKEMLAAADKGITGNVIPLQKKT